MSKFWGFKRLKHFSKPQVEGNGIYDCLFKGNDGNLMILNQDVMALILEHAYFNDNLRPDFHHLSKYARICRAWRRPTQALLFHEIFVHNEKSYRALRRTFEGTTEHSKWLRERIRILDYRILGPVSRDKASRWESRLPVVLMGCPQLYELRLMVEGVLMFQNATMAALEKAPAPRALQIAMHEKVIPTMLWSFLPIQLLSISSWKLEFLVMHGGMFNTFASGLYQLLKPKMKQQLVEFRWNIPLESIGIDVAEKIITWITQDSLKSLEVLQLPSMMPIIALTLNLRSLSVPTATNLPTNLHRLRELILTLPIKIPRDVAFYEALPPNLTHLGLSVIYPFIQYVLAIGHMLPRKLRILSLYCITSLSPDGYIEGGTQDVIFRIFYGVDRVQTATRSDLVRSQIYPRGVTIENMRAMGRAMMVDTQGDDYKQPLS